MNTLTQISILLKKDIQLELRNRSAFFSLILYLVGTVFICYLSFHLKTTSISSITWNTLFWIIMLFISINAIGKSFTSESRSRQYYYYFACFPLAYVFSKMIFNCLIMLLLSFTTYFFMSGVLNVQVGSTAIFLLNILLGAIGFSSTLTLVAAIAAKSDNTILMAILSFPVIIPMLLILIRISGAAIDGLAFSVIWNDILVLVAINIIVIAVTYLLFPYLWRA